MSYEVRSKYKNPDKYIERLKVEVERVWDYYESSGEDFQKERGVHWFNYENGVTKTVALKAKDASESRIDQTVKLNGKIIGYERTESGLYTVTMEIKEVRLKED